MSRLPSIPPSMPGGPMARRPGALMANPQPAAPGPAVAAPPPREAEPAQVPLNLGAKKAEPGFENTDQLIAEFLKEHHTLPKIVLSASSALALGIAAVWGFRNGGMSAAVVYSLIGLLAVVVSCAAATGAGWAVSRIFNEDFGSFGDLTLRFSAVAAAQFPVLAGLILFLGFFPAMIFNVPIMIGVTIWVAGVDLFRSIVFSIIVGVINFMLASFAVTSFVSAAA